MSEYYRKCRANGCCRTKIIAVLKGTVEEKADILKDKEESEEKDYE